MLAGCYTPVSTINYTDIAGDRCQTIKIKNDFYSAETHTDCIVGGQLVVEETQHSDLSMLAGVAGIFAALIGVGASAL